MKITFYFCNRTCFSEEGNNMVPSICVCGSCLGWRIGRGMWYGSHPILWV